ncbi:hypothetical protein Fmac_022698 [Flemingia macrophylla]|uniref:PHD-type domain-containing protein n=1 Tax=Flemingia macrophylla TaxID=520843 RepID=A0ABD1M0L2_9FABA
MRLESGTCNVCSAPCSSCMHLNRALIGSKAEEFSDENCRLGEANQHCTEESGRSSLRSRACKTSHMASVSSIHDSLSENAENRRALSQKFQDSKCLESLDDSTSCISRTNNANLVSSSHQINSDIINISCSSTSISHIGAERSGNGPSVDMSEWCMENKDSSLTKERVPLIVSGEKSLADKENLNNSMAKNSMEICPKSEADTENNVNVAKDKDHKYSACDGLHEKVEVLVKSPGRAGPQSEDESDESDDVEHDVKVCDICGDAGREDLLAICSRCSDGAEHTYCMREMLEKVPEGDWLCEECKYAEETANRSLDIEGKKTHKVCSTSQTAGKRPSESMEIATAAKRQALELSKGSPMASSPKRLVPLSRESSFKSVDKGKMKSGQQIPMRNNLGGDDKEIAHTLSTGPRSQSARSTLLKSNSFNNFNSKPRVKLVDEVVPQKQKGGVDHISKNMETPARMISKSMSFKSSNLGRSSAIESKVKMLSSKPGTAQDLKVSRHAKESGSFDRKFLSKIDRPVIGSTMVSSVVSTSKDDQKSTPHDETAKPSTVNNNREIKVTQDAKLYSVSKSNTSHKSPEPQVSSDKTSTSVNETQQDRLPRSHETSNQVDKTKDSSSDHVRSGVTNASKSSFCRKCKYFGHATECCTAQEFGAEESVTATDSSKEEMHKGNKLKAAIEAALLRRPEMHKKKEAPDQTNEFPASSTGLKCDVTCQHQVLISNSLINSISAEETNVKHEIIENSTFETPKCPSANDLKQLCQTQFCSQLRKSDSVDPTSAKPVVRDLPINDLEISSVLSKMSVFPEYEYIWQGDFKVHRNGNPADLYTGIQAHLSAWASPKAVEAGKYFLPETLKGNYERHYKGLLDHMIRNDLALSGTFDGVELLIFASNQLPENSQRWNMLFFLWGIFRGRRINHSDSAKRICIPSLNVIPNEKDFPTAVMTLSETRCSLKRMEEGSTDRGHNSRDRVPEHKKNIESKLPEAMGTGINSRMVETKINCEISVKQENSLSLLIPSVGCQEKDTATNISKDKIWETTNNDENHRRPKRKRMEDVIDINMEAKGDPTVKGVNIQPHNDKKVPHIDLYKVAEASAGSCQKMPWNEVNGQLEDTKSSCKNLQAGFGGIYGFYNHGARGSFNGSFGSCSSVEEKGCKEACDEKIIHEDLRSMERTFFPVDTHNRKGSGMVVNSESLNGPREFVDQFQVGIPNLELGLGGEMKPSHSGKLPFFVDKKNNQEKGPDILTDEREDESVAASLSLSLSFPSSNKEPISKTEPLPDVNRSFLLFGRFTDK